MSSINSIGRGGDGLADPPHGRRIGGPSRTDDHHVPRNRRTARRLPKMHVTWMDGSMPGAFGIPKPRPLAEGPPESLKQAAEAAKNLRRIDGMLRERWHRAGWDDRGGDLTVIVNQVQMGGNAYFSVLPDRSGEMGIGVRDARIGFDKSPAYSPTILFHELVHGIVGTELAGLPARVQPYLSQREHNAINESIADVLSTGMLGTDWRNGQEIRKGSPLRDLAKPSVPKWTGAVRRDTGLEEHTLAGVMSRAAVVAAKHAGTMAVVDAWYAGIDRHYRRELLAVTQAGKGRAIGAWVRATMRGAADVAGADSSLVQAVRRGWKAVGLARYASDAQLHATAPPGAPR